MRKLFLLIVLMFVGIVASMGQSIQKNCKVTKDGVLYRMIVTIDLEDIPEGAQNVLSQEMFGTDGKFEENATQYFDGFKQDNATPGYAKKICYDAHVLYRNSNTGVLCISYSAPQGGDVSQNGKYKERFVLYDTNKDKQVTLDELVDDFLIERLTAAGHQVKGLTNIVSIGQLFVAVTPSQSIRMNPILLHDHMTDYAMSLAGLDRSNIQEEIEKEKRVESFKVNNDDRSFDVVEQNAKFPGGENAVMRFLANNVQYPVVCQEQGIQGRVIVSFTVDRDGSISDVEVMRSPDANLSKEALRVVQSMPRWVPARQGNKYIRSRFNLPIMFRLG